MSRAEVLKIMAVLRGAYPMFYRKISREEAEDTVNLWEIKFRDYDYRIVSSAVDAITDEERDFPPNIGDVKAKIRLITGSEELTAMEAWSLVSSALRNSGYESKKEFKRLPQACQRVVGSPNQLKEWAMMDSSVVQSVVASNFQRSYKVIAQRDQEIAKLPPDVKKLISRLSDAKKMKELPETESELPESNENAAVPAPEDFVENAMNPGTGRSREDVLQALRGVAM